MIGGNEARGQVMVIGALLIAVLFVGLAIVLNGAIYTENLATQEATSTSDAVDFATNAEERLSLAARNANWNEDDHSYQERQDKVHASVERWDVRAGRESAVRGRSASIQVGGMTEGVRVSQHTPGDFMPADDSLDQYLLDSTIDPLGLGDRTNWLIAPDVHTRDLNVTVRRDELKGVDQSFLADMSDLVNELLTGSDVFWIQIDDGETTWKVYLFEINETGEIATVVTTDDETEPDSVCRVTGDWATIDFENSELRGDTTVDCPALSFYDELGAHNMYWVGGDEVHGSYHFIADNSQSEFRDNLRSEYDSLLESAFNDLLDTLSLSEFVRDLLGEDGSPEPFTTSAVYNTSLLFTYDDGDIRYERDITVTGG
ncbi:hypothetical protein HWV07_06700 [Natronomonas salina]|uniref:DUF7261 family protein n=1 Tax=Natronomonas salina TaxID=1710540 RepID=UPI0015B5CF7F|nr:hypothetical protein [Natronomonas salina]QLD88740.1 hypothetical protein HWV07_06700 [Natronomonas salina]